jgi:hypothetical protein
MCLVEVLAFFPLFQSSAKKSKLKLTTPMSTKNPKKKTQPKVTKQKTQQTYQESNK